MAHSALRNEAASVAALMGLAQLCRSLGAIEEAIALTERVLCLSPSDLTAQRLHDALTGRANWGGAALRADAPSPFIQVKNLLPHPAHLEILRLVGSSCKFIPARVIADGKARVDDQSRSAGILRDNVNFREIFWPFLEKFIATDGRAGALPGWPIQPELLQLEVTAYGGGGFYGPHIDNHPPNEKRQISFVYYFHLEPKRFKGGALILYDGNPEGVVKSAFTKLPCLQNSLVLFPSGCLHAVEPVAAQTEALADSRFTINGWLGWS